MADASLTGAQRHTRDTSSVVLLRVVAALVCTIGQIWVDSKQLGLVGAIVFVCTVFFCAMMGLKWPFFKKALRGNVTVGIAYSCNGAVIGSFLGALIALGALQKVSSWPGVAIPFVAASLAYYLVGKISCIHFRCCEAVGMTSVRLPVIEVVGSAVIFVGVVMAAFVSTPSLYVLAAASLSFATLRVFSRVRRAHGRIRCAKSIDIVGLLALSALSLILASRGLG